MPDFYPDIHEYLEGLQNSKSVTSKDLDHLIYWVRAKTGLPKDICSDIVKKFFSEIRNSLLRGEVVTLRNLGKFYISSPRTGNSRKIFPKFEAYDKLLIKINEKTLEK